MNKITFIICCALVLAMIGGCKMNSHISCPEFATRHDHAPLFAKLNHVHHKKSAETTGTVLAEAPRQDVPIDIKLPKLMTKHMQPEEIAQANEVFRSASNNKVSLVMSENNRVHFKAESMKDFTSLSRAMFTAKASAAAAPGGGGGMAIASGVLGIVAFLIAFGPYVGFGAFLFGLLAIILGAISLGSPRRGWAITGIVLGTIALAVAVGFIFVFIRFI